MLFVSPLAATYDFIVFFPICNNLRPDPFSLGSQLFLFQTKQNITLVNIMQISNFLGSLKCSETSCKI